MPYLLSPLRNLSAPGLAAPFPPAKNLASTMPAMASSPGEALVHYFWVLRPWGMGGSWAVAGIGRLVFCQCRIIPMQTCAKVGTCLIVSKPGAMLLEVEALRCGMPTAPQGSPQTDPLTTCTSGTL